MNPVYLKKILVNRIIKLYVLYITGSLSCSCYSKQGHTMFCCIGYFHVLVLKTALYPQHVNKSKAAKIVFVSTSRKEEQSVQIGLWGSSN